MGGSDVLLYQKNFRPFQRKSSILNQNVVGINYKDYTEKMEKLLEFVKKTNKDLTKEEIHQLLFENEDSNKVILPCSPQKFLKLLTRAIKYTEAIEGNIRLLRTQYKLFLFIDADSLCLNHANKPFFLQLLEYTWNIDFTTNPTRGITLTLTFHDIGEETQKVDLDTFRALVNQIEL